MEFLLYARKEPTTDDFGLGAHGFTMTEREAKALATKRDVVYYRDPEATDLYARSPWFQKPQDRRHKWLQGCDVRRRLVWLPDLQPEEASR